MQKSAHLQQQFLRDSAVLPDTHKDRQSQLMPRRSRRLGLRVLMLILRELSCLGILDLLRLRRLPEALSRNQLEYTLGVTSADDFGVIAWSTEGVFVPVA